MTQNWQKIQELAHGELANPLDTLTRINRAMDMVLDGYSVEKATAKGDVLDIIDKLPVGLANLVKAQLEVLKYIDSKVDTAPVEGCQLIIGEWFSANTATTKNNNHHSQ